MVSIPWHDSWDEKLGEKVDFILHYCDTDTQFTTQPKLRRSYNYNETCFDGDNKYEIKQKTAKFSRN